MLSSEPDIGDQALIRVYSYAKGYGIGESFGPKERNWTLDATLLREAITKQVLHNESSVTVEEFNRITMEMRDDYKAFIFRRKYRQELNHTEEWLAKLVAARPLVVKREGDFVYEMLRGDGFAVPGVSPEDTDRVVVMYKLMGENGGEIASSQQSHEFAVKDVMASWQLALRRMIPDDRIRVYQHPSLAFGITGYINKTTKKSLLVQPGGTSIVELQLMSVVPRKAAKTTDAPDANKTTKAHDEL